MNMGKLPKYVYSYSTEQIAAMNDLDRRFSGITTAGFYFVDETEAFMHGPFETVDKTVEAMQHYAQGLADECHCECHMGAAILHIRACCAGECEGCGRHIRFGAEHRHFERCGEAHEPAPSATTPPKTAQNDPDPSKTGPASEASKAVSS
jgi:hypothetical protein